LNNTIAIILSFVIFLSSLKAKALKNVSVKPVTKKPFLAMPAI
jgi:hypothetical protein